MKVRLLTNTTNTTPITAITIPMTSDATSRARLYSQAETFTLTLNDLITGSDIVILEAGTTTPLENIDANAGTTYDYVYDWTIDFDVDICIYENGEKCMTIKAHKKTE